MIFLVLGFFIWLYSMKHLQKSFLWFLVYKVFLVTNINILSIPGIPVLTLDMALTFWFFFRIYVNRKKYCQIEMPYMRPMLLVVGVYLLSTVFAMAGFKTAFSAYIKDVCNILLTAWMMWKVVNTDKDFIFFAKRLSVVILVTCLYGIAEKMMQSNPLVAYEATLVSDATKAIDFNYGLEDIYRGYRVQSVFEHAIGAGVNWGMYIIFVMYTLMKVRNKTFNFNNYPYYVLMLLCAACLFFTSCRGPILFLLIALLGLLDLKNKRFYSVFAVLIVVAVIGGLFLEETYINNLVSIFDSSYQYKVGGSSSEQRFDQMEGALAITAQSPIWGLGYKFQSVMDYRMVRRLLGLESIWLRTIVQFGFLGVVANLILAYYMVIKIPLKYKQKYMILFNAAYWVTASLTSLPGMLLYLYYLINFFFIKQSEVYKLNLPKENYES